MKLQYRIGYMAVSNINIRGRHNVPFVRAFCRTPTLADLSLIFFLRLAYFINLIDRLSLNTSSYAFLCNVISIQLKYICVICLNLSLFTFKLVHQKNIMQIKFSCIHCFCLWLTWHLIFHSDNFDTTKDCKSSWTQTNYLIIIKG